MDRISELISARLDRGLTPEEARELSILLESNPQAREEFSELTSVDQLLKVALKPFDPEAFAQGVFQEIGAQKQARPSSWATLAALATAAAAGLLFLLVDRNSPTPTTTTQPQPTPPITATKPVETKQRQYVLLEGLFERANRFGEPWRPAGKAPVEPGTAVKAVGNGRILFDDGTTIELFANAIVTVGSRASRSLLTLHSGHIKASQFSPRWSLVRLPDGEISVSPDSAFDLNVQGHDRVSLQGVMLTLRVTEGSVRLTYLNAEESCMAGEELTRCDQAKLIQLARAYDEAICCGYLSTRDRLFRELAPLGAQAQYGFGLYRTQRGQMIRKQDAGYRRQIDFIRQKLAKGARGKHKQRLEQELRVFSGKRRTLRIVSACLLDLYLEMSLQIRWRKQGPQLRTPVETMRSFEHFAAQSDWINAASCLTGGGEKRAKTLYAQLARIAKQRRYRLAWRHLMLEQQYSVDILALAPAEQPVVHAQRNPLQPPADKPALALASMTQDKGGDWQLSRLTIK